MGDIRKEFGKLYNKYIDKIYRFVFIKVNSQEIAEDICSEAFLRYWEAFKQGKDIKNHSAFVYQIARNLVIDYYRHKDQNQVIPAEIVQITDPRADLEEMASLSSDLEQVRASLTNLKDDYQDVIVWRYLDDLSIPEISRMMDKSEQAVRVTLHRALKALKKEVNGF